MTPKLQFRRKRRGLSLVELVVSMGLMSLIMLPIIGLMATSYKVYNAGCTSRDGAYARQVALDAINLRLRNARNVVNATSGFLEVQLLNGGTATLEFVAGGLDWTESGIRQTLASGLTSARFNVGAGSGATPVAGDLLSIEVATKTSAEPVETWSSTTLWLRPTI